MNHYEVVSVQEDSSITPYGNKDIETATNQVVNDPNEVACLQLVTSMLIIGMISRKLPRSIHVT